MKVSELLVRIRQHISDVDAIEYEDAELYGYINDGIRYLSAILITARDPECVSEITVSSDTALPDDFFALAGQFPIYIANGTIKLLYSAGGPVDVRYFASKPSVSAVDDLIPFKDVFMGILARIIAIYALNRNEFDCTQDLALLDRELQAFTGAKAQGS